MKCWEVGSGSVGLYMRAVHSAQYFLTLRNWLALAGVVSQGSAMNQSKVSEIQRHMVNTDTDVYVYLPKSVSWA